jgi:exopolyphosphatase/guanosine-5'-triphosphate,3'-diphosphate pyrophosphatase
VGSAGRLEGAVSCELGSVRLSEAFPALMGAAPPAAREALTAARAAAVTVLAPLAQFAPIGELLAVAGTATTVAAVVAGSDVEHVRGHVLGAASIEAVLARMIDAPLAERRRMQGMPAQRADILPAGAILLLEAMRCLRVEHVTVETNDLLLGILLSPAGGFDA